MAQEKIGRWIRQEIRSLAAYRVPEADGLVKLDAMENPYPWPEPMREPWLQALRRVDLNRYPDPEARVLKARLREYLQLPQGGGLLLGNGSDELIQLIMMTVAGPHKKVLYPAPSFAMYGLISRTIGLEPFGVPLQADDFGLDLDAMLAAIEEHQPAVVFIAYPNNPTGNLYARRDVKQVIRASPGLVVIDEAYFAFSQDTFMQELGHNEDLLVLRTLSKVGLAGLRVGMLAGSVSWLEQINKVRLPYNLNNLSQVSADFMLAHAEVLEEQVHQIRAERDRLYKELQALDGIKVWPSETNFLLLRVTDADRLFSALKANNILVKDLNGSHPLLSDCLRVTVGTPNENQMLLDALHRLISR